VSLSADSSDNKVVMDVDNFFHGVQVSYSANNPVRGLVLDLNGHNQNIGGLVLSYGYNNPVVTNSSATNATLTLSGSGSYAFTNGVYAGWIAGNLSLVKTGAGTQTLGGTNTYTGATVISNGTLKITGSGLISNSPAIVVVSGGRLDVTGLTNGWTLFSNQVLGGTGSVTGDVVVVGTLSPADTNSVGALTVAGNLSLSSGATCNCNYDKAQDTADEVRVSGNLALPSVATVNLQYSGDKPVNKLPLFSYGGVCSRTDFSGWSIAKGFSLQNDADAREVFVVPTPVGMVLTIQ
jgi:autotransporter-associated beta strand protein